MSTRKTTPPDRKLKTDLPFPEMSKSVNDWTAAWVDGATRWYGDSAKFVSERLERDREILERLAGCKTFAEATEVHQDWMGRAAEDYARESRRMLELALLGATFLPSTHREEEISPVA